MISNTVTIFGFAVPLRVDVTVRFICVSPGASGYLRSLARHF